MGGKWVAVVCKGHEQDAVGRVMAAGYQSCRTETMRDVDYERMEAAAQLTEQLKKGPNQG